ncbi:MAG: hypothetical protein SchgKO_25420 [Schleiferiaceae bacterium]|jgi:uncharacterized RDD family membrane protein YckC
MTAIDEEIVNSEAQLFEVSKGKRFAHLIIDTIVFYVIFIAFTFATIGFVEDEGGILFVFTPYLLWFLYYSLMEHFFGKTIGKFLTSSKVVDANGEKPTFGRAAGRTLARFIPFEAFTFLGDNGLHDSLSKTRVVEDTK